MFTDIYKEEIKPNGDHIYIIDFLMIFHYTCILTNVLKMCSGKQLFRVKTTEVVGLATEQLFHMKIIHSSSAYVRTYICKTHILVHTLDQHPIRKQIITNNTNT